MITAASGAGGGRLRRREAGTGLLRGAVAVVPHAADGREYVALALQLGATVEQLASVFGANPTITELAFVAARRAC